MWPKSLDSLISIHCLYCYPNLISFIYILNYLPPFLFRLDKSGLCSYGQFVLVCLVNQYGGGEEYQEMGNYLHYITFCKRNFFLSCWCRNSRVFCLLGGRSVNISWLICAKILSSPLNEHFDVQLQPVLRIRYFSAIRVRINRIWIWCKIFRIRNT